MELTEDSVSKDVRKCPIHKCWIQSQYVGSKYVGTTNKKRRFCPRCDDDRARAEQQAREAAGKQSKPIVRIGTL